MEPIRPNPTLSEDLISEILVRVPVKSLLRFQSVCKSWLSLIKQPAFVKSQLLRATTIETDQTFIMSRHKNFEENKFVLLYVDSHQIGAHLNLPYSRGEFNFVPEPELVGSANGIVCVATVVDFFYPATTNIYLWNPAIRQSKLIPSYSCVWHDNDAEALGFGYDQIDHDFKVVRVVMFESPPSFCAEVYSDNRNAWRKVPHPIDIPCCGHFDVCVNGFLCGIGEHGMMVFDLNKEVLNCAIKLPIISNDNISVHDDDKARIIEFNDSVAVAILVKEWTYVKTKWGMEEKIHIWTLNNDACLRDCGVEASWTPMFSIDTVAAEMIIHGYFRKRDLLLLIINNSADYTWISSDVDKKAAKIVPLSVDMADHHYTCNVYKYTESLVSLAGFTQVKWNAGADDN